MNKRWFIATAVVETYQSAGAYGDVFAAPVTDAGFLDGAVKIIRDKEGEQVVSASTWYTSAANAAHYTPDSKVTTGGRTGRVIVANSYTTPLGIEDHVEVHLT